MRERGAGGAGLISRVGSKTGAGLELFEGGKGQSGFLMSLLLQTKFLSHPGQRVNVSAVINRRERRWVCRRR